MAARFSSSGEILGLLDVDALVDLLALGPPNSVWPDSESMGTLWTLWDFNSTALFRPPPAYKQIP